MKSKRFSEEQIIGILKQTQAAMKVVDLCRMHRIKGVGVCCQQIELSGFKANKLSGVASVKSRV